MNTQIPLLHQPDGSYTPNPAGVGSATVVYSTDPAGNKTAIIGFAGFNQALVTFDATGSQMVSYTVFDQMATPQLMTTVENIIRHITRPH